MQRTLFLTLSMALSCCTNGCNSATDDLHDTLHTSAVANRPTISGVAVIDVDRVAKILGRYDFIATQVGEKELSLNRQLAEIQAHFKKQLDDLKDETGDEPTPPQKQQLADLNKELGGKLREAQREAQNSLVNFRAELINRFRHEVKPVARQVAEQRGMNVVVSNVESLLFTFSPSADISDEVARLMMTAAARTATMPDDRTLSPR